MLRNTVHNIIQEALEELGLEAGTVVVERPGNSAHGDYAFFSGKLPVDSDQLQQKLETSKVVEKVEMVNGFCNIFLVQEVWRKELEEVLEERENYAHLPLGQEQTVNVEFVSANPTGQLHVGNGRGLFYGDVLGNLLEKAGYNVEREYIVNDAKVSVQIRELGKTALGEGEAYKTEYLESIIDELQPELKKIAASSTSGVLPPPSADSSTPDVSPAAKAGYLVANRVLKDIQTLVQEKAGVQMDRWFHEEELFSENRVEAALGRIPTYEKDGAVWARTTDYGDEEDRVVVRSDGPSSKLGAGTPGYFLSDISYHIDKASRADTVINIWGADHQGHVKRMQAMAEHLGFGDKLQFLITQMVQVVEADERGLEENRSGSTRTKKMSKRAGTTIPLSWLLDEVGVDAARWFYLSKALSTHMDFDVALAKKQGQENPVYYVQYSYARSHQIFAKDAENRGTNADLRGHNFKGADLSLLTEDASLALAKKCAQWPELVEDIAKSYDRSGTYELHKLTTYAEELARTFHSFYEQVPVLVDKHATRLARLALVRAYQVILKDVLDVLGVSAPEKM